MNNNIVTAAFGGFKTTRTRNLWQWDYGMTLVFKGLSLPEYYTVHFANHPMSGTAKKQLGSENGVIIPDEYLTTGLSVFAWVYLHEGETDGETVYMVEIPVKKRPQPIEEAPTPVQQDVIEQTIAALNAGVETVQEAAEGVQDSIDTALQEAKDSGEFDGPQGPQGETGPQGEQGPKGDPGEVSEAELTAKLADKADVIVDTASGAIASFPDGAAVAAKDITIAIEPVQSGSGDPSPDNVRPISGWTGANVTRTGFNVWDEEWEVGSYDANGQPITQSNTIRTKNYILCIPNTTYFYHNGSNQGSVVFFYGSGHELILSINRNADTTFTTPAGTHYIRFRLYGDYGTTYNHDVCINLYDPAKNGTYEPGHVVTYPISWQSEAGTVYGGTLDVTTGLLTVTHGNIASYNGESLSGKWISSMDVYSTGGTPTTGAQVVYELATPQTYQLTPTEIEMLLGKNNVWADTGDTTVTYRADTKLYIQKINAPTDDDMIADAQIASGKYFIIGGNLYKSTTTIPAGDAINPGSNCILTNLADALNALNT